MNGIQKIIKIFAICLAIFIIMNICGWIIFGITFLVRIGESGSTNSNNIEKIADLEYYEGNLSQDINEIDIDIKSAILSIESSGTEFSMQINDKSNFGIKQENGKLKIRETSEWFWNNEKAEQIKINIPEGIKLKDLDIDSGGGKIKISDVKAEEFCIDQGAGVLEILDSSFDKTSIEGGAGEIKIISSDLNNLKLDAGVGRVEINSTVTGNSKIECGIGEIDLTLNGNEEDYKIMAEKGIGSIKIKGNEQGNNVTYGEGKNTIKIERWNWKCEDRV